MTGAGQSTMVVKCVYLYIFWNISIKNRSIHKMMAFSVSNWQNLLRINAREERKLKRANGLLQFCHNYHVG